MEVLTRDNAEQLLADTRRLIMRAGDAGVQINGVAPLQAYCAGILSVLGDVEVVTRGDRQYFVWVKKRLKSPRFVVAELAPPT